MQGDAAAVGRRRSPARRASASGRPGRSAISDDDRRAVGAVDRMRFGDAVRGHGSLRVHGGAGGRRDSDRRPSARSLCGAAADASGRNRDDAGERGANRGRLRDPGGDLARVGCRAPPWAQHRRRGAGQRARAAVRGSATRQGPDRGAARRGCRPGRRTASRGCGSEVRAPSRGHGDRGRCHRRGDRSRWSAPRAAACEW